MESVVYHKTYGTQLGFYKGKPRFYIISDGYKTNLHYAKQDFAMKRAEEFTKHIHRPFIDFQGRSVTFTFTQE